MIATKQCHRGGGRDRQGSTFTATCRGIGGRSGLIWPGNVQWLCATCNKRKQDRDPILHGQRIQQEHEFRCQEQLEAAPAQQQPALW